MDEPVAPQVQGRLGEDPRVYPRIHRLGDAADDVRGVAFQNGPRQLHQGVHPDLAQGGPRFLEGDTFLTVREELFQGALGVSNRPARGASRKKRRLVVQLVALLEGDALQERGDFARGDAAEGEPLAAAGYRGGQLVRVGGGQDEDGVLGGLLQRLQQGVEGFPGKHVDFVYDVDFVAAARRGELHVLPQRPDFVYAAVRGGGYFDDVHVGAGRDGAALVTRVAGLRGGAGHAVQRLRQQAGRGGFPHTARPGEEVGVSDAALAHGVLEHPADVLLADGLAANP